MKVKLIVSFLVALLNMHFAGAADSPARPNIVFILVDDLRWDGLSCTGSKVAKTPNIDRIAKEGAKFNNFFVTIPLCAPSRGCFLTGQYSHKNGILDNTDRSAQSHKLVTYQKLLHDSGYETAHIGKWHMGNDSTPRPGYDYWVCLPGQGQYENPMLNINGTSQKVPGYITDILNGHAVKFVKQEHKKPFSLYLAHKAVHGPFTPPERFRHLYEGESISVPPSVNDSNEDKPVLTRNVVNGNPAKAERKNKKADGKGKADGKMTGGHNAAALQQFRCLAAIDEGVGQIFKALEETKQLDNTIFVFTSDNGFFWGEHGLGDKRFAYEESIRDPLLIRYPKLIKAGTTLDQIALNIDIAPTFLELANAPVPKAVQGRSLLPLFKGDVADWRKSALHEYFLDGNFSRTPTWQAARNEHWKYIHYVNEKGLDELFDLKNDPYEMKNLISDPKSKEALAEMKNELARLLKQY